MSESEKDNDLVAGFEFDDILAAVLREKGLMFPVSIQEVEKAEARIDEESIELPESLRDPLAFLHKASSTKVPCHADVLLRLVFENSQADEPE